MALTIEAGPTKSDLQQAESESQKRWKDLEIKLEAASMDWDDEEVEVDFFHKNFLIGLNSEFKKSWEAEVFSGVKFLEEPDDNDDPQNVIILDIDNDNVGALDINDLLNLKRIFQVENKDVYVSNENTEIKIHNFEMEHINAMINLWNL